MKKELIEKIIEKFNDNIIFINITSIYNKINLLLSKFVLNKNGHVGNIILLNGPLVEPTTKPEITNKYSKDAQEQTEQFIKKMEENFSEETLTRMYHNLETLKILEDDDYLIKISLKVKGLCDGGYIAFKNTIITYSQAGLTNAKKLIDNDENFQLEQIYSHELLHMASTSRDNNKICCGFRHEYKPLNKIPRVLRIYLPLADYSIGTSLNEGYTELLNTRIFNREGVAGRYSIYRETARLIENVIGQEKMTNLFFTNDLRGLVNELSNYISEKETKRFIVILDQSMKNKKLLFKIPEYFIKLYDNKIKKELKENKITLEQAKNEYLKLKKMIANLIHVINTNTENLSVDLNIDSIISNNNQAPAKRRGNISGKTVFVFSIIASLIIISIYIIKIINTFYN